MEIIEIPFGAKDSELQEWTYTIPDGMKAEIRDGKVIIKKKESEDERIRKELSAVINDLVLPDEQKARFNAWLEKQKEQKQPEVDLEKEIRKHTDLFQADIEYPLRLTAIKFYELGKKGGSK